MLAPVRVLNAGRNIVSGHAGTEKHFSSAALLPFLGLLLLCNHRRTSAYPLARLRLQTFLKTEHPAKLDRIVTRVTVLPHLRSAEIKRDIESGNEFGVTNPVLGA